MKEDRGQSWVYWARVSPMGGRRKQGLFLLCNNFFGKVDQFFVYIGSLSSQHSLQQMYRVFCSILTPLPRQHWVAIVRVENGQPIGKIMHSCCVEKIKEIYTYKIKTQARSKIYCNCCRCGGLRKGDRDGSRE